MGEQPEEQRQWIVWLITRFLDHDDVKFRARLVIIDCINAMRLMHKYQEFEIKILDKYFFRTPDDRRLCSTKYRGLFVSKELTKDKLVSHIVLSKREINAMLGVTHWYIHKNFGKYYPTERITETLTAVYWLYEIAFHEARHFGDYLELGYEKWKSVLQAEAHMSHDERPHEKRAISFSVKMLKRFAGNAYLYTDWYEDTPEVEREKRPWEDISIG